jgi:16S rRNA G527 N7-methylase RsmG
LQELYQELSVKIQVLSPSVDLCELIVARGHSALQSVVNMAQPIRRDMLSLSKQIEKSHSQSLELEEVMAKIKTLIKKVDDTG